MLQVAVLADARLAEGITMEVSTYIDYVATEGALFAEVAEQGPLDVQIEPCPGWDMAELIRHLGMIHLWAGANVAFPDKSGLDVDDLPDLVQYWPDLASRYPDDAGLVPWYRQTLANLVEVLSSAPTNVAAFDLLPSPHPLTMWARRQASEIAVHRFDAQQARGLSSHFDPHFAADMTDELLSGFAQRPGKKVSIDEVTTIHAHAHDVDEHWFVTLDPTSIITTRTPGDADLNLSATAQELYLLFWNRLSVSEVDSEGPATVMDDWRRNCRIRWSV